MAIVPIAVLFTAINTHDKIVFSKGSQIECALPLLFSFFDCGRFGQEIKLNDLLIIDITFCTNC